MRNIDRRTLVVIAAIAITIRLGLIAIPFAYVPDVYYYDTQASHVMLSGMDPYGYSYLVPKNLATAGAMNVFAYLPGVLEFLVLFAAFGDVRLGLVLCDILVAFALFSIRGKSAGSTAAVYLLLPPVILFSTWYPNDNLVGMAFIGLGLAARLRDRFTISAVLTGLALASSQFVWVFYPFILVADLKAKRLKEIALGLLVAAAALAPFVIWNPAILVSNTVYFEFARPVQNFITPEPFGVNVNPTLSGLAKTFFRVAVPVPLKIGIVLLALLPLLWKTSMPQDILLKGSFFLLISIFVLSDNFSWWYLELPLMTLMIWFIASREEPTIPPMNS